MTPDTMLRDRLSDLVDGHGWPAVLDAIAEGIEAAEPIPDDIAGSFNGVAAFFVRLISDRMRSCLKRLPQTQPTQEGGSHERP